MPNTGQNLQNPFDYFDAIFLINLDEREDRLKESLEEFNKYSLKLKLYRFPAIKFNTPHPMAGRAGCLSSHRAIIQFAKDNNLKNVMVFEDDFCFLQNPIEVLKKNVEFLSQNSWHLFYLGQTTTSEIVEKPLEVICDGVLRLRGGLTTHAITYNNLIYDTLLNEIPSNPNDLISWLMQRESIDGFIMKNIQPKNEYKCYTTDPMLCIQKPGFSDVDCKFTDYSKNLKIAFDNERKKA